jgi:hypothetical protein
MSASATTLRRFGMCCTLTNCSRWWHDSSRERTAAYSGLLNLSYTSGKRAPGATKFNRKQEQAIAALLSSRSVDEAAKSIGLSPNTLLRWLEIPEFRAQHLAARREAVRQAVARLQPATGIATLTILKLMTDPNVLAALRLRAADCMMEHAFKGIELEDIEMRVAELERAADTANR